VFKWHLAVTKPSVRITSVGGLPSMLMVAGRFVGCISEQGIIELLVLPLMFLLRKGEDDV